MLKKTLSRRDFIKTAGVTLGISVLAACGQKGGTPVATQTAEVKEASPTSQVTATTAAPTQTPEPVKLEVWWNTNLPDLTTAEWKNDPNDPVFQAEWYWGGLARLKYRPFLSENPGVILNITTHGWDADLRTNQLMAIASGETPDTTYGEAYVSEFAQLGMYADLDPKAVELFPDSLLASVTVGGLVYALPKSTGATVLFVNLDKVSQAGADPTRLPTTWDELLTLAQAISKVNKSDEWGHTAYYTKGPAGTSYGGQAIGILHWFNQNHAPLVDVNFKPQANLPASVDTWLFHNQLVWTSSADLINHAEEADGGLQQLFNDGVVALISGWTTTANSVGAANVNAVVIPFPTPPGGQAATTAVGNDMESAFISSQHLDLAKYLITKSTTDETAQKFLAGTKGCGFWLPALKSLLIQYATYDNLDGYETEVTKKMVRVMMQQALEGNDRQVPAWKKNGIDIYTAWNASYGRILGTQAPGLAREDIQKELDSLQAYIVDRLV